jgi:hypothetical protein
VFPGIERFPAHFMFQLTFQEFTNLRLQFVTTKGRGGRRTPPYAFTEHGAIMVASVLNSPIAVRASIEVVRAFVRLGQILASHVELARKLAALENKYDTQFKVVFDAIRQLRNRTRFEQLISNIGYGITREKNLDFRAPSKKIPHVFLSELALNCTPLYPAQCFTGLATTQPVACEVRTRTNKIRSAAILINSISTNLRGRLSGLRTA